MDGFSRAALDEMMLYEWPGNVRELQNAVERAVVVVKKRFIEPRDLPISSDSRAAPQDLSLAGLEKGHIAQILEQTDWNIARSAGILEIDRSTLYKKIKRYNLRQGS